MDHHLPVLDYGVSILG